MTGASPATLVWIAVRPAGAVQVDPGPPDARAERAIVAWARQRGLTLEWPRDEEPPALPSDAAAAGDIEGWLDRARDAVAARDTEAADRATEAAEALLRAHPELPQAAWLMAEVSRARAARWRRAVPEDTEAADRDWARAEALDGGRVAGIAETASTVHPAAAEIALDLPDDDDAWLDGRPVPHAAARSIATHAGLHALVVTTAARGRPVWARWIEVAPGPTSIAVDAPRAPPCSVTDTARATVGGDVVRGDRVECPRWFAVLPGAVPGSLRVAACERGVCEGLIDWQEPGLWSARAPEHESSAHRGWPAWATWTLAGVVAAGAGIAVGLAAGGAFQARPTETRFVSGGLKGQ